MGQREFDRVRKLALALPEVTEKISHGAPCFFVQGKRALCRYHDHHRGDDRISLWCPVPAEMQEALVAAEPERFFKPQPSASGVFGNWLGMYLDTRGVDWAQARSILREAYRIVAPKRLAAELD